MDKTEIFNSIVSSPVFHDIFELQTMVVVHSASNLFLAAEEDREESWSACRKGWECGWNEDNKRKRRDTKNCEQRLKRDHFEQTYSMIAEVNE